MNDGERGWDKAIIVSHVSQEATGVWRYNERYIHVV